MLGPGHASVTSLLCALETSLASQGPRATSSCGSWLAVWMRPCVLPEVSPLPWRRRCCASLGLGVYTARFRCRWSLILTSTRSWRHVYLPSPRALVQQLNMYTADMLVFLLAPSNGDWMDLGGHHTPTVSRTWVLLAQTSKVLSRWFSGQLHGLNRPRLLAGAWPLSCFGVPPPPLHGSLPAPSDVSFIPGPCHSVFLCGYQDQLVQLPPTQLRRHVSALLLPHRLPSAPTTSSTFWTWYLRGEILVSD